jgi:hypothetical protein
MDKRVKIGLIRGSTDVKRTLLVYTVEYTVE